MSEALLKTLRSRHSVLLYESFELERRDGALFAAFNFKLEPGIVFRPTLTIPNAPSVELDGLKTLVFNLGMVELISYWKAACPAHIIIKAGALSDRSLGFWQDLFRHGLGEFYFRNLIDFSQPDFCAIEVDSDKEHAPAGIPAAAGDLILTGGGKDSSLTLELLKSRSSEACVFAVNPTRSALQSAQLAGYRNMAIAQRTIDPNLLELNRQGYLNGHTPFSAYLAFCSALIAAVFQRRNIVLSNESSANEENVSFHGLSINHQYSKTARFEGLFREYCRSFLSPDLNYFSFLRPLNDLQISALFARFAEQHNSFRSCNVNQKKDSWCGNCPKCAFVYLSLFPFVGRQHAIEIFGADLFSRAGIINNIEELIGIKAHKPFECVGTVLESRAALALAAETYSREGAAPPAPFAALTVKAAAVLPDRQTAGSILRLWNKEHFLPAEYEALLREAMQPLL